MKRISTLLLFLLIGGIAFSQNIKIDTTYIGLGFEMFPRNFKADSLILKYGIKKCVVTTFERDHSEKTEAAFSDYELYDEKGRIIEWNGQKSIRNQQYQPLGIVRFNWLTDSKVRAEVQYFAKYLDQKKHKLYDPKTGRVKGFVAVGDTSHSGDFIVTYDLELLPDGQIKKARFFDYRLNPYDSMYTDMFIFKTRYDTIIKNGKLIYTKEYYNEQFYRYDKLTSFGYDSSIGKDSFYHASTHYYDSLGRLIMTTLQERELLRIKMIGYLKNTEKVLYRYDSVNNHVYNVERNNYDASDNLVEKSFKDSPNEEYVKYEYHYYPKIDSLVEHRREKRYSTIDKKMKIFVSCSEYEKGLIVRTYSLPDKKRKYKIYKYYK